MFRHYMLSEKLISFEKMKVFANAIFEPHIMKILKKDYKKNLLKILKSFKEEKEKKNILMEDMKIKK